MPTWLTTFNAVAPGVSAVVASATFLAGVITLARSFVEFSQQNALRRFEKFQEIRQRFIDDSALVKIQGMLDVDDPLLKDVSFSEKSRFLGLYEEVALMLNSKLIKPEVAYYMFGYYAIRCYQNTDFWIDVNKDSPYWKVFIIFSKAMLNIEINLPFLSNDLSQMRF